MSGPVLVFVEHAGGEPDRLSLEALTVARGLAGSLGATLEVALMGAGARTAGAALGVAGVTTALVAEDARLDAYAPAAWATAIRTAIADRSPNAQ